jgi:hypothetical protein
MPSMSASRVRKMCGIWVDDHSVISPVIGIGWASTPRGSMAFGISRGW